MSWVIILFLFFTFLGFLLSLLFLLKKKGNRQANLLLSIYTFLNSFELLNNCLRWSGELNTPTFVHITLTQFPIWLINGPLVYFYVRNVVAGKPLQWKDAIFAVPPLIIVAMLSPFYFLGTEAKLDAVNTGSMWEIIYWPRNSIWLVIIIMYAYAIYTYAKLGPQRYTGFRENKWVKWFVGAYVGYTSAFALYFILLTTGILNPEYDYFLDLIIVFFIGMLAFFGFVQPEVFEGKTIQEIIPFVKYKKTGLSDALALEMKEKLEQVMKDEKLYLQNDLRLDDLAEKLNLSRNHTSQIINQFFNLSFFDYVNRYRVHEALDFLVDKSQDHTISQIAFDSGFNNRASFYKAFKKFADHSPTYYLEHNKAS